MAKLRDSRGAAWPDERKGFSFQITTHLVPFLIKWVSARTGADWQFPRWKPTSDLQIKIDQRFPDYNRDHDPDQKPFRKNQGSIFILNSISDFQIKIGS